MPQGGAGGAAWTPGVWGRGRGDSERQAPSPAGRPPVGSNKGPGTQRRRLALPPRRPAVTRFLEQSDPNCRGSGGRTEGAVCAQAPLGKGVAGGVRQGATLAALCRPTPRAVRPFPPGVPACPAPSGAGLAGPGASSGGDERSVEQLLPLAAAPGSVPTARPQPSRDARQDSPPLGGPRGRLLGTPPGRLGPGAARTPRETARTGDEQKKKKPGRTGKGMSRLHRKGAWRGQETRNKSSSAWIRGASPPGRSGHFTPSGPERGQPPGVPGWPPVVDVQAGPSSPHGDRRGVTGWPPPPEAEPSGLGSR